MFALIRGNDEGWASREIVGLLIGSALLFVAFVLMEHAIDNPMFELRLFSIPTFTGGSIVAFTIAVSLFAMFLYLTLYLQNVLGLPPLQTGVRLLPLSMISFVVPALAGPLSERLPIRWFLGGGLVLAGVALLLMHGLTDSSDWTALPPVFCVAGVGIGLVNQPLASTRPASRAMSRTRSAASTGSTPPASLTRWCRDRRRRRSRPRRRERAARLRTQPVPLSSTG